MPFQQLLKFPYQYFKIEMGFSPAELTMRAMIKYFDLTIVWKLAKNKILTGIC